MVDRSSSKRCAPIRIRLAVYIIYLILRVNNLIGKGLSCRESRCRIVADLTRFIGKVAIGKARYLLNIVFMHLDVQIISFPNFQHYYTDK